MSDASLSSDLFDAKWVAEAYGVFVPIKKVAGILGYSTTTALRRSAKHGRLELRLFHLRGRRGLFADAEDVAFLLRSIRCTEKERP